MNPFKKLLKGTQHQDPSKTNAEAPMPMTSQNRKRIHPQAVELGTIEYINLTTDGKHGDYDQAIAASLETGKPSFANFVEWSG